MYLDASVKSRSLYHKYYLEGYEVTTELPLEDPHPTSPTTGPFSRMTSDTWWYLLKGSVCVGSESDLGCREQSVHIGSGASEAEVRRSPSQRQGLEERNGVCSLEDSVGRIQLWTLAKVIHWVQLSVIWYYKLTLNGSRLIMSDSLQPRGLYSPWNSPGQNTAVCRSSLSRGSSQPRDRTQVFHIAGGVFTSLATREAQMRFWSLLNLQTWQRCCMPILAF